jgi:phosphotransferase system  glucose/maltose/N-acetylglucosamine-specific IIC component
MGALGKLSKSFLLPIALLPIAGLFIGIGSAITQIPNASDGVLMFGTLVSQMGSIVFGNLSVLFLISAIIAYTNDSGSAVIAGIIAFLVFNVMIAVLSTVSTSHYEYAYTATELNGMKVSGVFIDDIGTPLAPDSTIIDYVLGKIPNSNNLQTGSLAVSTVTSVPNTYNLLF